MGHQPNQLPAQSAAAAANATPATPNAPLAITRLSGPQFKQFHEALLAAFDQESLTQMVRLEMGVNINSVAGGSNLSARRLQSDRLGTAHRPAGRTDRCRRPL